jgi:hypothetical protein
METYMKTGWTPLEVHNISEFTTSFPTTTTIIDTKRFTG